MENKTNYYVAKLDKCMAKGLSLSDAAFDVINAYIDVKPTRRKKKGAGLMIVMGYFGHVSF